MNMPQNWQSALAFCLFLLASLASPQLLAEPLSSGWQTNPSQPAVQVRVTFANLTSGTPEEVQGLLEVKLDQDWKTYWRAPGEGGIAPQLDWAGSENIAAIDWQWPMPERYQLQGIETVGYKDNVSFPLTLRLIDAEQSFHLKARLTLPSCTTICVLTDYDLNLKGTASQLSADTDLLHRYQQSLAKVPVKLPSVTASKVSWDNSRQQLKIQLDGTHDWQSPNLFFHAEDEALNDLSFSPPQLQINEQQLTAFVKVKHWLEVPELSGKSLSIDISDTNLAATVSHPIEAQAFTGQSPHTPALSLWAVAGLALLGGLILNLMPCVLPVLGLKIRSILLSSEQSQQQIRTHFLASALGVLLSFWLIAGALALLKWSGNVLGWGIQFQNPWFIAVLLTVTWLFTLNLLNLFEFRLPSGLNNWMAQRGNNSHLGQVLQGMFATFLATPCTAPFLGTAVAFALGADYWSLALIFTLLGIGMASPWLLVAAFPSLVRCLPKPGRWMAWLKPLFAIMMAATGLWLFSLLASFISPPKLILLAFVMLFIPLVLVTFRFGRKRLLLNIAGAFWVLAALLLIGLVTLDHWRNPLPTDHTWQALDVTQIEQAVTAGQIVFVDVTADWCITCQANKIGVLLQQPVFGRLGQADMVLMRGDWTRPSDTVSDYLKLHNSYGVPFNRVYGPAYPDGINLPTIYTSQQAITAINLAGGKP